MSSMLPTATLAAPALATPLPNLGAFAANQDAEIVSLTERLDRLEAEAPLVSEGVEHLLLAPDAQQASEEALSARDASSQAWRRVDELAQRIAHTPVTTLAGVAAKARAITYLGGSWDFEMEHLGFEPDDRYHRAVLSLLRDLTRVRGDWPVGRAVEAAQ